MGANEEAWKGKGKYPCPSLSSLTTSGSPWTYTSPLVGATLMRQRGHIHRRFGGTSLFPQRCKLAIQPPLTHTWPSLVLSTLLTHLCWLAIFLKCLGMSAFGLRFVLLEKHIPPPKLSFQEVVVMHKIKDLV